MHAQNFYFFINFTHEEVQNWFEKVWHNECPHGALAADAATVKVPHPDGNFAIAILCPTFAVKSPDSMNALIHEISHAAWFSLGERGYRPTLEDHEEFCYLQGYLIQKVWESL